MNFYKHFIGDYQRDTGHLSLMEHGAYRLMLDTFYATQKALPKDRRTLYRLLRADGAAERKAIDSVVSQFWAVSPDGLVNLRAETEIGKAKRQAEVNRQIAHAREEKKRLAKQIPLAGEAGDVALSCQSGYGHGVLNHPENQVYEVSRADGSSKRNEKQAINGVNVVKNTNKDAFMAMSEAEDTFSGVPGMTGDVSGGTADVGMDMADEPAFPGEKKKEGKALFDPATFVDKAGTNRATKGKTTAGRMACVTTQEEGDTAVLTEGEPIHSHNQTHSHSHSKKADGARAFAAADLARAMRKAGVEAQAGDPRIMVLADQGISPDTVAAACEEAKRARPGERIGPVYVVRIVERWSKEAASIVAHGAKAHGKAPRSGAHAERKRVMEGLTGIRIDAGMDASRTIEGSVRFADAVAADGVFDGTGEDDDGFSA